MTTADTGQYLLASACEQIIMPPSGILIVPGVRAEMMFFKGLLDKLGLQFDALQMGKYKGAAEPFTRAGMSKPLRESFDALVDDMYEDLVATIAADRHLKDYQVKTLIDQGLFTAAAAKTAGLIDDVLYADQFQDSLKTKLKADKLEFVTDYKKKHDRHRLLGHLRDDEADGARDGRKAVGGNQQEAENRRGLRRRPDRGGQEQQRRAVWRVGGRIDHPGGRAAKGRGRFQGGRHRLADRQPWRLGHRQRPDLAGDGAHRKADHRQHERRGRQRRLLHRHGREEDRRRPRHADRLDRRDRRQAGHPRIV